MRGEGGINGSTLDKYLLLPVQFPLKLNPHKTLFKILLGTNLVLKSLRHWFDKRGGRGRANMSDESYVWRNTTNSISGWWLTCAVLDIHGSFLALCLPDSCVSVCLKTIIQYKVQCFIDQSESQNPGSHFCLEWITSLMYCTDRILPHFLCNSLTHERHDQNSHPQCVSRRRILILGLISIFDFEPQPREDLVYSGYSVRDSPFKRRPCKYFKI